MNEPTPNVDPQHKGRTIYEEADIGSGEKSPGQHETEQMIREIPRLPPSGEAGKNDGRNGEQDEGKQNEDKQNDQRQATGA